MSDAADNQSAVRISARAQRTATVAQNDPTISWTLDRAALVNRDRVATVDLKTGERRTLERDQAPCSTALHRRSSAMGLEPR